MTRSPEHSWSGNGSRGSSLAGFGTATATNLTNTSMSQRLPPKRVIYRSTNLIRTAPDLGTGARDSERIREAHRIAEEVREQFRLEKAGQADMPNVTGIGVSADAQRHQRRVKMNRDSAAISRVRREAYVSALELQLVTLEREYKRMQAELENCQKTPSSSVRHTDLAQRSVTDAEVIQDPSKVQDFPSVQFVAQLERIPAAPLPVNLNSPANVTNVVRASATEPYTVGGPVGHTGDSSAVFYLAGHAVTAIPTQSSVPVDYDAVLMNVGSDASWRETQASKHEDVVTINKERTQVVPDPHEPSSSALPELVPQLAQIEPDFFTKLMMDYDTQGIEAEADPANNDLLSLYRSLPE